MTTLYEISAKLRQLPGITEEAAKRAAPRIKQQIAKNVAAEVDTAGRPWPARSPKTHDSGPMLTGAARAVQVVVRGSAILLALPWHLYGRHQAGAINQTGRSTKNAGKKRSHKKDPNKRLIRREVIPSNPQFLPPMFAAILREEINAVMSESLGQKIEAA